MHAFDMRLYLRTVVSSTKRGTNVVQMCRSRGRHVSLNTDTCCTYSQKNSSRPTISSFELATAQPTCSSRMKLAVSWHGRLGGMNLAYMAVMLLVGKGFRACIPICS